MHRLYSVRCCCKSTHDVHPINFHTSLLLAIDQISVRACLRRTRIYLPPISLCVLSLSVCHAFQSILAFWLRFSDHGAFALRPWFHAIHECALEKPKRVFHPPFVPIVRFGKRGAKPQASTPRLLCLLTLWSLVHFPGISQSLLLNLPYPIKKSLSILVVYI